MRRFPPPWSIEEANNACFIVRDAGTDRRSAILISEDSRVALGHKAAYRDKDARRHRGERGEVARAIAKGLNAAMAGLVTQFLIVTSCCKCGRRTWGNTLYDSPSLHPERDVPH